MLFRAIASLSFLRAFMRQGRIPYVADRIFCFGRRFVGQPRRASRPAVTIRADRSDSSYTSLAASSLYASVGRFDGATSTSGFIASGTLIAPDWVLTAGHVVDQATSLNFTIGGATYSGTTWTANPGWTGDLLAGYDIGLVHLNSAVANVDPATRYTGSAEQYQVGTAVGYGMTGTGLTGSKKLDGKKRAAQNAIDTLQNSRLFLSDFDNPRTSRDNAMGLSQPLNLEGLIAPGDSGGGVFITTKDGTFLAGVNSFAGAWDRKVDSDYGDISGHIRVSAFNSWIDSVIGGNQAMVGGSGLTFGAARPLSETVPEPSTIVLLLMAAAALLAARSAAPLGRVSNMPTASVGMAPGRVDRSAAERQPFAAL